MTMPRSGVRRLWVLGMGAVLGMVLLLVGWGVADHLEQDNDFCTSCHLEPGVPLHLEIRQNFDALPTSSLASLHAGVEVGERVAADGVSRDSADFRCIDCHGGASWTGRLRVKALAGLDLFWYVVGRFEEPTEMAWPLWDEDCQKCHVNFSDDRSSEWKTRPFHALASHNVDLGVDCVECHRSHDFEGDPEYYHLNASWVRSQCARCHSAFETRDK